MYKDYFVVCSKHVDTCYICNTYSDALFRKQRLLNPSLFDIHKVCFSAYPDVKPHLIMY